MSHQACWQLHQWPLLQALTLNGSLQCWEADKGSGVKLVGCKNDITGRWEIQTAITIVLSTGLFDDTVQQDTQTYSHACYISKQW